MLDRSWRTNLGTCRTMSSVTVPTKKQAVARYRAEAIPANSITAPASAGPRMRPEFITAELRTTAFIRSSRSTRSRTMASRAGVLMAWNVPSTKDTTYRCHTLTNAAVSSRASPSTSTATRAWVSISNARRSNRSAKAPPNRTNPRVGIP